MKNIFLIVIAVFIFASCTDNAKPVKSERPEKVPDPSTMPLKEITVNATGNSMAEMKFDITEIRVMPGQKVKLTLRNTASEESMIHNIVIVQPGASEKVGIGAVDAGQANEFVPDFDEVIAHSKLVKPGESTTFEFNAPAEKAEYEFICSYPGHFTMMKGKFIVD